ncbi:NAD(P)-dependent oxidoreductase [Sporomusa acidovorans]|uniref:2-(Hydroxymethyl)glutarate dehydrogenase n=1 Tax=Sporomusa acidovorans (strain ATCC 49682 / DSM 3132 / Mol) TaxID=1123286 RepID=A0ABZ3J3E9_SPOA4|nr:NAD(P)-dependent oxidoreductase [Sporomusa acidovorans]OZC19959.1 2-(hydroxymethyl)glutarate dehydrogenase [Sporomusa acidovorans DSM 3132]SDD49037.1 2-hydroxymethylglutarate dehydrogenase [Sporomusa acidovorans]
MLKVGFVGLGAMGRPMASNILQAGYSLTVYDIGAAAVEAMKEQGAIAAAGPRQVAQNSDMVMISLPNSTIVEEVVSGKEGLLAGSHPGQVFIDLSSVTPGHTKKMAALAAAKGVGYLDAPVSGGVAGAAAGTLTIMVGGDKRVIDQCQPVLQAIGKKVYHAGPVGSGDAVKLVNNLLLGVNMAAVAEAMTLGVKAGLDPEVLLEIIGSSSGRSYALAAKLPNFVLKGNFEPGFTINLQYKDLEMAVQTAKELGIPLGMANFAQQIYETARAKGLGQKDIAAVITINEELAGIKVREKK